MKKKVLLLSILLLVAGISFLEVKFLAIKQEASNENQDLLTIVTSFYPVYIIAANLVDGIDGVELINLTENHSGCLHDYQMTTKDMKKLESADIFIINGGGMESFAEDIAAAYPTVSMIDSSQGIDFLEGEEQNAHVWLDPDAYMIQIENIMNGLIQKDASNQKAYEKNSSQYLSKIENLKKKMKRDLPLKKEENIIIFHDSFAYLARYLGLNVVYSVELDGDSGLSAGQLAEVVDEVKKKSVSFLFTETQYSDAIAEGVARETGASVYTMDSLVSGEMNKDSYIKGVEKNIKILKKAFY